MAKSYEVFQRSAPSIEHLFYSMLRYSKYSCRKLFLICCGKIHWWKYHQDFCSMHRCIFCNYRHEVFTRIKKHFPIIQFSRLWKVTMAIHRQSWIIPELYRCPVDMLSQILYDKTVDGGKLCCEFSYVACLGQFCPGKSDSFSKVRSIFKECIFFI